MDKFQTNVAGNIDSGTEVLANNLTFMQSGTEKLFTDFFGNTFTTGIVNTDDENSMFPLTANANGTFNVGVGTAYVFDPATELYKRIEINLNNMVDYNSANPTQTTDDGTGVNVVTPKSTGCKNIPITNTAETYWIDLQYLQVCDNGNTGDGLGLKNYSIAKKISSTDNDKKRFYQWADGYKIVLQTGGKQNVVGICLGTVTKDSSDNITFSYEDKADHLLIKSNAFLEYLTSGSGMTITTDPITNKTTIAVDNSVPFSINGGPSTGVYLVWGGQGIQLIASIAEPLILHPANSSRYTVSANDVEYINVQLAVQELEGTTTNINGIYTLCINNTDKENNNTKLSQPKFEVMRNIFVSKIQPATTKGTIWLDTSTQPYVAKWYNGSSYVAYNGVPVAYFLIQNTALVENGVAMFDYNKDYTQWNELGKIEPVLYDVDDNIYPDKDLIMNGATISVLDYYDFYRATKHTFNGTDTTFELPDTIGKVLWGGLTVSMLEAGLPNIKGKIDASSETSEGEVFGEIHQSTVNIDGCFDGIFGSQLPVVDGSVASNMLRGFKFDASKSNSIYNDNISTVQPPALQVPFLVRVLL